MQPAQFQELLDKYAQGACSPEEEKLIHDWYDSIGPGEDREGIEEDPHLAEARVWAAIKPESSPDEKKWSWLSRAAVISIPLLAAVAFYFFSRQTILSVTAPAGRETLAASQSQQVYSNPGKKPLKIYLADGSKVILKSASELHVDKDFGNDIRAVRLEGAAYFKVKADSERPFVVYSNEVVTRVLGTSFSIQAYDSESEITVAVRTGKVSVFANGKDASKANPPHTNSEVILTPNQKMVYHRSKEKVSKELVEKPEIILPNSDLFKMHFENADVRQIFDVLAENYGVEIRYDDNELNQCKLTTSMSDEGLYERIEVICKAIGASYTIDDAIITIKSDGC